VAYELRKRLRSFELVYRLGGEEFLIVLPGVDTEGGLEIAERLRDSVEAVRPQGIRVTISLGLSAGSGEEVDYDVLFRAADAALYDAKRAGRNRVVCASAAPVLEVVASESTAAVPAPAGAVGEQLAPSLAS
jgi:diguanylate cyclase (GGDEF)-like protein